MAEQGDTLRAAQEVAVRDVLKRLTTIPGLQRQALAAELVDAVLAAGSSAQVSVREQLDALQFAFNEQYAALTRAVERWRAEDARRAIVWPAMDNLLQWLMDRADQASRERDQALRAEVLCEKNSLRDEADANRRVDQAHAAGYATAVANLRDDQRFEAWRWEHAHHVSGFRVARGHAADYLEAVGPGAGGQVEP